MQDSKPEDIARAGSVNEKVELANNKDAAPEILYYMANDPNETVRKSVASNPTTPIHASRILADDENPDVRATVGERIGSILPGLDPENNARVARMAMDVADVLAKDKLPTIRAMIAHQIKTLDNVPHELVMTLARDAEDLVSLPVLEFSPMLKSEDLVELISTGINSESLAAISRRQGVSETVSSALVGTGNEAVIPSLLANRTANIGLDTMEKIVELAEDRSEWHSSVVDREDLPTDLVARIAGYVTETMLERLIQRNPEVDHQLQETLRNQVQMKLQRLEQAWDQSDPEVMRAMIHHRDGRLNPVDLSIAATRGEETYVIQALTCMTDISAEKIKNALQSEDAPKVVVALSWKAGLGMGFAVAMQLKLLSLSTDRLIKEDSSGHYPFSKEDMSEVLRVIRRA